MTPVDPVIFEAAGMLGCSVAAVHPRVQQGSVPLSRAAIEELAVDVEWIVSAVRCVIGQLEQPLSEPDDIARTEEICVVARRGVLINASRIEPSRSASGPSS